MAEDDEIDILGDFSFNSCFAQNNQGIPSCSDREDTVHPQWLLDSTATNWYDTQSKTNRLSDGSPKKLSGNSSRSRYNEMHTSWTQTEKDLLRKEMAKYGRNVRKISQTLITKSQAEIQALIEAEYGVYLDTPSFGLEKHEDLDDVPTVVQEEIVTDEVTNVLDIITTGKPTVKASRKSFKKRPYKTSLSISKQNAFNSNVDLSAVNPSEILYEDDLVVGSTESVGSELNSADLVSRSMMKQHRERMKAMKKIGNHRRKVSRSHDRRRNKSKDNMKSPPGRQRKDSSLSEECTESPKMQIVFSSGQALPVSIGEQVIKIEKKKDTDPESDIEIDIDSDNGEEVIEKRTEIQEKVTTKQVVEETPVVAPQRKFEPMPKRHKRINLDGGGGYTIMHTEAGDLYEIGAEPRRERAPKKAPVHLIQCRVFNTEKPAPYEIRMHVSALIAMDVHAHTSRAEVMGLTGGHFVNAHMRTAHNNSNYTRIERKKLTTIEGNDNDDKGSNDKESNIGTINDNQYSSVENSDNMEVRNSKEVSTKVTKTDPELKDAVNIKNTNDTTQNKLVGDTNTISKTASAQNNIDSCHKGPSTFTPRLEIHAYRPAAAAACGTHCDMDPVSQACCAERLHTLGLQVCGWHHSHPTFQAAPSLLDLRSQLGMQAALERENRPLVALITSQHWPHGRSASHYRCFRVEESPTSSEDPIGYQFSVKLVPDLTEENLDSFLEELIDMVQGQGGKSEYNVDMVRDVCPQAGLSYLEKCISSVTHHMHSAGYGDGNILTRRLILGLRDVFR